MRVVFVGGGDITVGTARILIDRGDEVIIVEQDEEKIEELSETLDCSFLHGDGSKPHILKEAGPGQTDVLL
jgi:trk system potassium uptake protein